jgi:hypothetical protein
MASAYHIVHYKRFNPHGKGGAAIEALCRSALDNQDGGIPLWQRVNDRVFDLPAPETRKIILNRVADLASAVFGELCLIQADGFQALIELIAFALAHVVVRVFPSRPWQGPKQG